MINILTDRGSIVFLVHCEFVSLCYDCNLKKYVIIEDFYNKVKKQRNIILGEYTDKEYALRILEEICQAVADGRKIYRMPSDT